MRLLVTLLLLASTATASAIPPSLSPALEPESTAIPFPVHANPNTSLDVSSEARSSETCVQPKNAVKQWYYKDPKDGPYECSSVGEKSGRKWAMLRAFRRNSRLGIHYQYTKDKNDPTCLEYWGFYTGDGNKMLARYVRTTTDRDIFFQRWCALPVYRKDGKQGKQWDYCTCTST